MRTPTGPAAAARRSRSEIALRLRFRHLIFDLDGTLIDSAGDLAAAANHALSTLALAPLPPATIVGFVGNGVRRLVQQSLQAARGPADDAATDRALAAFLDFYAAHLLDATVLYPGIDATLRRLRANGCVLTIATNKPEAFARTIIDGLGLGDAFVAILGGDSLPTRKPDPAVVRELAMRTGVAADETLLVGDSTVDVATARAARIAVCAVTWGLGAESALRAAQPDFCIAQPAELLDL